MLSRMSDEDDEKAKGEGEPKDEGVVLLEQTNQLLVRMVDRSSQTRLQFLVTSHSYFIFRLDWG
jgi:hypothetical protein